MKATCCRALSEFTTVLVSALSLSATFGVLVWVFQDGHGAGALHVTPAPLEVGIVVLMAALFALWRVAG